LLLHLQLQAAAREEEAKWFTARICRRKGAGTEAGSAAVVPLAAAPSEGALPAGERRVGDVVRLIDRVDGWALLHPLELARVAADYQDYWHALLKDEVPRQPGDDAWIHFGNLELLEVGGGDAAGADAVAAAVAAPGPLEEQWLGDAEERGEAEVLKSIAESLTIVVSTSPAEHHCDVPMMMRVLRSLRSPVALRGCRLLVVFDAPPREEDVEAARRGEGALADSGRRWVPPTTAALAARYFGYRRALEELQTQGDPALVGVEFFDLPRWGHLVGTVRHALDRSTTPYVLLHQHDLVLGAEGLSMRRIAGILRALASRAANYVLLNRDVNCAGRSTQYLQSAPHRPAHWRAFCRSHALRLPDEGGTALTPLVGFSDQTHFARADWVRGCVLGAVGARKCCMEFAMHERLLLRWLHEPAMWERTYMLGGMLDGPFVFDLVKNGSCWAEEADAYSPEKDEEMYVEPAWRVRHPERPGSVLALYADGAGVGRAGSLAHFPDADAERNTASWRRFGCGNLAWLPQRGQ